MTTNHEHLREVAERAISPGEEWYDAWQMRQILMHEARVNEPALSGDVAFIAEVTPQVIIALLDELAALRKENEGLRVNGCVPEGYVLVSLGSEPDETKFRLMIENIWAFHKAMDEAGAPRDANGRELSMYGRALLWKVSEVEKVLADMRASVRAAIGDSHER